MRINYNQSAILANSSLNRTNSKLSNSIERLSSGLKINHAKDNPAGLAIAHRMDSQIRGLNQATDNTNDGISVVESADGAMSEISAIIQRLNELANQAANDTKTDEDRKIIDEEVQQLKQEITRIAQDTEFNGQPLLDGTFDLRGYTDDPNVKVATYSDEVITGKYNINNLASLVSTSTDAHGNTVYTVDVTGLAGTDPKWPAGLAATYDGEQLTITGNGNFEMKLDVEYANLPSGNLELDITGIGAMKIQMGANEHQELAVRIPEVSLKNMHIQDLDVTTAEGAQAGIEQIKYALSYISSERSRLGAYENRMEHNTSNLAVSEENMTSSYSRIMDVDMAEEMVEYTTQQVLEQAGISMLAQANERPQQVLQLLQ